MPKSPAETVLKLTHNINSMMDNSNKDVKLDINEIDRYLERAIEIRKLSVPSISDAGNEAGYRSLFLKNAKSIIPLFEENKAFIEKTLGTYFNGDDLLTSKEIEFLSAFAEKLHNDTGVVYSDASLLWRISDRLYQDALKKDDVDYLISQIDLRIMATTGKVIQAKTVNGAEEIWTHYQKLGQKTVELLFEFLEKDKFSKIESEESRELVVINSRYFCVLYEAPGQDPDINEKVINRLIASYDMSFDKDYTDLLPEYDWVRHRVKCLEYLGQLTERNNEQGVTNAQAEKILEYVLKLKDFYDADREMMEAYISAADIDLFITKNKYYAGKISNEEHKKKLIYYYRNRLSDRLGDSFKEYSTFINFQLPNEYIGALNRDRLTEEDISNIEYIYQGVIMDAFTMPNKDEFSASMEYFTRILEHYIEIPGGISFKDFSIRFMAAIMPQVYIHIISVAEITRCLTGFLINRRPELFFGIEGARSIDEVKERAEGILAYAYNAGIVHDIGKIGLLPVLSISERPMFTEEEKLLAYHPISGRILSKGAVSTSSYSAIISGNVEYNDKTPQKDGYNSWKVKEKVIVDILRIASDLDRMAENLERQNKEISVKDFFPALNKEKGKKYAPYILNILSMQKVQNDIDFILNGGREDIYRRTFIMLKSVEDRGRV